MQNKTIVLLLIICLLSFKSFSQCCSGGSAIGISTNAGLVDKNKLRINTFLKHSYSEVYFNNRKKLENFGNIKNSSFIFQGIVLNYGISHRFNIESETGYFYSKVQNFRKIPAYQLKSSGLSNGVLSIKYGVFLNTEKKKELTFALGLKYPFAFEPMSFNNVQLPEDLQPGTSAFGFVSNIFYKKTFKRNYSIFLINRSEYNLKNGDDYIYGAKFRTSLIASHQFLPSLSIMLQMRHEYNLSDYNNDKRMTNTGSQIFVFAPTILTSIKCKWNIALSYEHPFYKSYNGYQLSNQYAFMLSINRDISFRKQ
ncbi:MAG: hypothetical protein WCK02_09040 [Bacteroidota bacterium]